MIQPRKMTKQEQDFNNRVWALRMQYNDFDDFTEDIDDIIAEQSIENFRKKTKQFNTPAEYLKAIALMSKCINNAEDVPQELYNKIKQTREDFKNEYERDI